MSQFQLVLDDDLFEFFCRIKNGTITIDELSDRKISNFFKLYRPSLTNKAQLDRLQLKGVIEENQYKTILNQIVKIQGSHNLDLSELAKKHTNLKIVLTENTELVGDAYVNIHNTIFDSHYVICKNMKDPREDLYKKLIHIFSCSTYISIYDPYIPKNAESFLKFLKLLPENYSVHCNDLIKSKYYENERKELCKEIIKEFPRLQIKPASCYTHKYFHDRYIQVGDNLEIILSSGIEYLFNLDKEITCIFRCLK